MLLREILCYKRDSLEVGTPLTNICKSKRRYNYYILTRKRKKRLISEYRYSDLIALFKKLWPSVYAGRERDISYTHASRLYNRSYLHVRTCTGLYDLIYTSGRARMGRPHTQAAYIIDLICTKGAFMPAAKMYRPLVGRLDAHGMSTVDPRGHLCDPTVSSTGILTLCSNCHILPSTNLLVTNGTAALRHVCSPDNRG